MCRKINYLLKKLKTKSYLKVVNKVPKYFSLMLFTNSHKIAVFYFIYLLKLNDLFLPSLLLYKLRETKQLVL